MNHFKTMRRENNGYGNIDDSKRVDKAFNYHFCFQNIYNFQQLNRIYEVNETKGNITFENLPNGEYRVKSESLELK